MEDRAERSQDITDTPTREPLENWEGAKDKKRSVLSVASYLIYGLLIVALALAASPILGDETKGTKVMVVGLTIPILSAFGAIALLYKQISKNGRRDVRDTLLLKKPRWRQVFFAIGIGFLCQILLAIIATIIRHMGADLHSSNTTDTIGDSQGMAAKIFVVLASSLCAPFAEEVFFRGFIFNNLSKGLGGRRINIIMAALFSAAAFALMHSQGFSSATDFLVLGWTFIMGFIMSWLVRRTGSVWVSFAAHATYNAFIALILFS